MKLNDAIQSIEEKFTSGNDVSVTRVTLTLEEWTAIRKGMCKCSIKPKTSQSFPPTIDIIGISHCVVDTGD
jgi:hypothetical protein